MAKTLVEMAAEIIQSQCSSTAMTTEEIANSLQNTFQCPRNNQLQKWPARCPPSLDQRIVKALFLIRLSRVPCQLRHHSSKQSEAARALDCF